MADFEELQQKEIELDLSNVPRDQRTAAKEAVGAFVVDQILSKVADGVSPVDGKKFPKLTKNYADKEKGGNLLPNLELEGDMLSSLDFRNTQKGVAVGIMSASQRPKADGHNNFSGDSKLPERRFIAGTDQEFIPQIMKGVKSIVAEFEAPIDEQAAPEAKVSGLEIGTRTASERGISLTFEDLVFEDDIINKLFGRIK